MNIFYGLIALIFVNTDAYGEIKIHSADELGVSNNKLEAIDNAIKLKIKDKTFPGAVLLMSKNGKIFHLDSYGYQNIEKNIKMNTNSLFRIFSMTKPITSAAVMILYDRGHLKLNDPITKFFPSMKNIYLLDSENMSRKKPQTFPTVLDLLTHSSGITYGRPIIVDHNVKNEYRKLNVRTWNQTNEEFIKKISQLPLVFEPSSAWEYGHSTDVLARIVEKVSGMQFDVFIKDNIFVPLQMNETGYKIETLDVNRIAEQFPEKNEVALRDVSNQPKWFPGGHGLVSSAVDYWKFCEMFLNNGTYQNKEILKPSTVELITKNQLNDNIKIPPKMYPLLPKNFGFGLGFATRKLKSSDSWYGEKGDYFWLGYAGTNFLISPKNNFIFIFMAQQVGTALSNRNMMFELVKDIFIN